MKAVTGDANVVGDLFRLGQRAIQIDFRDGKTDEVGTSSFIPPSDMYSKTFILISDRHSREWS